MQMRIDEIIVRKRVRKDLGDVSQLMESMKNHGLMNPIVVTSEKELIAGHRRLDSAKRLAGKRSRYRSYQNERLRQT
jgi:ParB family chromosome partitioning protein